MSQQDIDFYFDYVSPTSYLAWHRVKALPPEIGDRINLRPILLGGLFKGSDNQSPMLNGSKGKYIRHDIERAAGGLGVPFLFNSHFPFSSVAVMRGAVVAQDENCLWEYSECAFAAAWSQDIDISSEEGMAKAFGGLGKDYKKLFSRIDEDVKSRLKESTQKAADRGAFGAPTFFVGNEMFFGQDRVEDLVKFLAEK